MKTLIECLNWIFQVENHQKFLKNFRKITVLKMNMNPNKSQIKTLYFSIQNSNRKKKNWLYFNKTKMKIKVNPFWVQMMMTYKGSKLFPLKKKLKSLFYKCNLPSMNFLFSNLLLRKKKQSKNTTWIFRRRNQVLKRRISNSILNSQTHSIQMKWRTYSQLVKNNQKEVVPQMLRKSIHKKSVFLMVNMDPNLKIHFYTITI